MVPGTLRIWLASSPVRMSKSIDTLRVVVVDHLLKDPDSDGVFVNAQRDRAKLLWRDSSGWCLLYKRLDARELRLPPVVEGARSVSLDARALAVLLEGVVRARKVTAKDIAKKSRALALSVIESAPKRSA